MFFLMEHPPQLPELSVGILGRVPNPLQLTEASVTAEEWVFPYRGPLQRVLPRGSDERSADMTLVSTLIIRVA